LSKQRFRDCASTRTARDLQEDSVNAGNGTTTDPVTDTVHELNDLRRGRGLNTANLGARLGPRLRHACAIEDADAPALVRRKVVLRLSALCEQLPDDLRVAATVALALHVQADGEFLDRRIAWLADHFERDPRTARRRVDTAFRLLGERLDDEDSDDLCLGSPEGWYVESLRAVLRMDLEPAELTEERRIVATVDDLREITVSMRAPRGALFDGEDQIEAELLTGGELVDTQRVGPGDLRFVIRLPEPLHVGQRHDYSVRFTSYPRSWTQPYDLLAPLHRCEHFAVRVRFAGAGQPDLVWQLERQGMSYGLQWSA
jgi:hypothetical protein